jgi:hypothetical protein
VTNDHCTNTVQQNSRGMIGGCLSNSTYRIKNTFVLGMPCMITVVDLASLVGPNIRQTPQ